AMLEWLIEVGRVVAGSLDVDVVVESALASVRDVLGAEWCVLRLLDEETGELVLKGSLGMMGAELEASAGRVRPEGSLLGKVLETGEPVVVEDLAAGGLDMHLPYCSAEMRAVAVVPVRGVGKILGTLKVYSPVPRRWTEEEVGYLGIVASQTGLALENARLYSSLREYYLSAVRALAAALEARDVYTRGHSLRVARWARACAGVLGLGAEEQEQVYLAGLLHDLGKIGVREGILLKPGRLDEEEMKEMQGHPVVGAGILEPARFPAAVTGAVRHHHEDYGGGGYPAGLVGEEIPLLARIIRVADAYDAMTSARPYRQAFSAQQAREELRRCAGRQFDPRVVEAFLGIPAEGMEDVAATGEGGTLIALLGEILFSLRQPR
ncbi:MAG: HD domain-containing phosphohydrolase, partial [Bacillota bacterium]